MALSNKAKEFKAAISMDIISLMESRMPPVSSTLVEILGELIDERIECRLKARELVEERLIKFLLDRAGVDADAAWDGEMANASASGEGGEGDE